MDEEPPARYELKKYQAGYGLLVLAAILGLLGWVFDLWEALVIAGILGIAGIAFQFDKSRGQARPHDRP